MENTTPIYKFVTLRNPLDSTINTDVNKIKQTKLDNKAVNKLIKLWLEHYGKHNNIKPWKEKRSILDTALDGFSYGAERGQIKRPSDHNHIIPLYSYGVTTYDFDMKKTKPMAALAIAEAQEAIKNYFASNESPPYDRFNQPKGI